MILQGKQFRNAIIFVESPNKTKLFQQVFSKLLTDNKVYVLSTRGHIVDIKVRRIEHAEQKLDIKYKEHTAGISNKLKNINYSPDSDLIILATDPDREGEAIGWHLLNYLHSKFNSKPQYVRIRCNSLTYNNIVNNITNLENDGKINSKLVDVYFARLFIDIIIGINGSSMLWDKLYGCRSIGRVQSIVTYMLFQRELLIQKFIPQPYLKVSAVINDYQDIKIDKILIDNKEANTLTNEEKTKLVEQFNGQHFKISDITNEIKSKNAILPLDIATLSSAANLEFNFSVQEVYSICQKLYEGDGIEVDGNKVGIITYMRTDSREIDKFFIPKIHDFIASKFSADIINNNVKASKKSSFAQESHEAIRITDLTLDIMGIIENLNIKEKKIARKILYHTLAPFIYPPKYNRRVYILSKDNVKIYVSSYKTIEDGYYCVNDFIGIDRPSQQFVDLDPNKTLKVEFTISEEMTKNYDRFTEGSLISEMKKMGIGRPSTYAYICNVIKNRLYSIIEDKKYYLVSAGFVLSWFIELFLNEIINYDFTAKMEHMLDEIVDGTKTKEEVIQYFFDQIYTKITAIQQQYSREQVIAAIQDSMYKHHGDKCVCGAKYCLKFIRSKAKIVCDNAHIYDLYNFGYNNNNYLQRVYDTSFKIKKIQSNKKQYKRAKVSD